MSRNDVEGESVTGGFLLDFDAYNDELNRFNTAENKWPVGIKSPDEEVLQETQFDYISQYVNTCEECMIHKDFVRLHSGLLNYSSFVDYYIIQTITGDKELKKPKSIYVYKKRNGEMYAGPLWDFDYSTYMNEEADFNKESLWYKFLFKDSVFVQLLKERWREVEPVLRQELVDYLNSMLSELEISQELNFQIFPIRNDFVKRYENGDENLPFAAAVKKMRDVTLRRMDKIESLLSAL